MAKLQVESLAIAIFETATGLEYDDNEVEQEKTLCKIMDWLDGERLPNFYAKHRQHWIKKMSLDLADAISESLTKQN